MYTQIQVMYTRIKYLSPRIKYVLLPWCLWTYIGEPCYDDLRYLDGNHFLHKTGSVNTASEKYPFCIPGTSLYFTVGLPIYQQNCIKIMQANLVWYHEGVYRLYAGIWTCWHIMSNSVKQAKLMAWLLKIHQMKPGHNKIHTQRLRQYCNH